MNIYKAKDLKFIEKNGYELLTPHLSTINPAAIRFFNSIETPCEDCEEIFYCPTDSANCNCKNFFIVSCGFF